MGTGRNTKVALLLTVTVAVGAVALVFGLQGNEEIDEDTALANDCALLEQLQEDQRTLLKSYPTEWSDMEDDAYARADGLYYYGTMALGEMGRDQEGISLVKHVRDNYPVLATLDKTTYDDTLDEISDLCPNL